eukprot:TRINITY_DN78909_c0_g1_i1.p1 TRINITY_DN78909_c0_g1~~TRINITY_DN78909_c0_g1_i1.p1  ORF type:complete len:460 (+),score=93.27 TRINITY_DN78909_c0_g1_i1:55-1434(+)
MASSMQQMQSLFSRFDVDGSGKISASELESLCSKLNMGITPADIGKVMREVDRNNDGAIDFNEFVAWTREGRKSVKKKSSRAQELSAALQDIEEQDKAAALIPFTVALTMTYIGTIKYWDLKTGNAFDSMGCRTPAGLRYTNVEADIKHLENTKSPHELNPNCFCIDWKSGNLVTGSADHTLKLWNCYGHVVRTFLGSKSEVTCVDVDWKRNRMASAGLASQFMIWSLDTSSPIATFQNEEAGGVRCLAVNWKMGKVICACGKLVQLWDISEVDTSSFAREPSAAVCTESLLKFAGHSEQVTALIADWSENKIVSAGLDRAFCRWDLQSGTLLQRFTEGVPQVTCMSRISSGSGQMFVTGDREGKLCVWNQETGKCEKSMAGHGDWVTQLSHESGGYMMSGGRDGKALVWNLSTAEIARTIEVSEITEGVWVMDLAAHEGMQERRSLYAYERHGTFSSP